MSEHRVVEFHRGPLIGKRVHKVTGVSETTGRNSWESHWTSIRNLYGLPSDKRPKPVDLKSSKTPIDFTIEEFTDGLNIIYDAGQYHFTEPAQSYVPMLFLHDQNHEAGPMENRLSGKLRLKIKDMTVNLAQDFAEYRQTCSMFSGLAQDIVKTFQSLRRGRGLVDFVKILKQPRTRHQKRVADKWLEYQFGLRPLLSDLGELVEGPLAAIQPSRYLEKSVYASENYLRTYRRSEQFFVQPAQEWWTTSVEEIQKWRFTQSATYRVTPEDLHFLTSYGLTNLLELGYELLPWSFVLDWMFNVGQVISGLDALVGVNFLGTQSGSRCMQSVSCREFGCRRELSWSHRGAVSGTLGYGRVIYKPSESLKSVLNGLALLTQIRSKR